MRKILIFAISLFLVGCSNNATESTPVETEVEIDQETDLTESVATEYEWFNNVAYFTEIPVYPVAGLEGKSIKELYDNNRYIKASYGSAINAHDESSLQEAIQSAMQNFDIRFAIFYTGELNDLQDIVAKAYYSDPMILGTVLSLQYGMEKVDQGYFLHFVVGYTTNRVELATKIQPKFEEFYATLEPKLDGKSVDEKISIIHRAVIEHMEYVDNSDLYTNYVNEDGYFYADRRFFYDYSPYGFFVLGEGVCQAYATAMQMLLERAGIESHYVVGYMVDEDDGYSHAWNLVKTENGWRHIDSTNNDMGAQYEEQVSLTFYKLNDEVARQYYVWDESFYPKAE